MHRRRSRTFSRRDVMDELRGKLLHWLASLAAFRSSLGSDRDVLEAVALVVDRDMLHRASNARLPKW